MAAKGIKETCPDVQYDTLLANVINITEYVPKDLVLFSSGDSSSTLLTRKKSPKKVVTP